MPKRELLITAGCGEWRAALLEQGVPVELYVERGDGSETGSIHLGRVRQLVPALGAALVDIGSDRPGFLPQRDVVPRGSRLHEGERVIAQVRREAQGGKAARLTMSVTLRGRFGELILGADGAPHPPASRVPPSPRSRREGRGEGHLTAALRAIEAAPTDVLNAESAVLRRCWQDILERAARLNPPARLHPMATFAGALNGAVPAAPSRIVVDDPAAMPEIRAAFAGAAVEWLAESEWPIALDSIFAEALSQTVPLPGGGSVHFEATRAATLIDVDSGVPVTGAPERVAFATNLAAAAAIARHIRLRNLGGGMVVDFVGLDTRASRDKLRVAFAEALAADPASPRVLGWTRLGHLELVRPRRGRPLAEALLEPGSGGALVKTAVTVAHEALRALRREARSQPGRQWRLVTAPQVAAALSGVAAVAVAEAERRFARKIAITAESGHDRERFQISTL